MGRGRSRQARRHPGDLLFLRLGSGQIVLVTMYSKNVREDIDPRLLRRIKEVFERG